jgi:hypothetical protein
LEDAGRRATLGVVISVATVALLAISAPSKGVSTHNVQRYKDLRFMALALRESGSV